MIIEPAELLKNLKTEIDFHASHATETSTKFWYTLGGTITTLVAAVTFKESIPILRTCIDKHAVYLLISIALIFVGYGFIVWALGEHAKIHKLQRDRLERAVEALLDPTQECDYPAFWNQYGLDLFSTNKPCDPKVKLITREPDTRRGWRFHDRKIEMGFVLIMMGVVFLIALLIYTGSYEMPGKPDVHSIVFALVTRNMN